MFYACKGQGNQSATPKFAFGVGIAEKTVTKSGKCQHADTMPSRTGSSNSQKPFCFSDIAFVIAVDEMQLLEIETLG